MTRIIINKMVKCPEVDYLIIVKDCYECRYLCFKYDDEIECSYEEAKGLDGKDE